MDASGSTPIVVKLQPFDTATAESRQDLVVAEKQICPALNWKGGHSYTRNADVSSEGARDVLLWRESKLKVTQNGSTTGATKAAGEERGATAGAIGDEGT